MPSTNALSALDSAYTNRVSSTTSTSKMGTSELGFSDFVTLLVAQLKNQDMMNPMSDTDFIAQMAQFSALQAMNTLSETNNTSYAASLVGKKVTAAALDKNGALEKTTGTVTGVGLFDGTPTIYIGEKSFKLEQIMVVGELPASEETPGDDDDNGSATDGKTEETTDKGNEQ